MQNGMAPFRSSKITSDPAPVESPADLQVVIPHRSPQLTRAALRYAVNLAKDLTRRIRTLAEESTLPVSAEVVYTRDWEQGLRRVLPPASLVLFAIKRS